MSPVIVQVGRFQPTALARDRGARRCANELEKRGLRWQPLAREHGLDLARPETPGLRILALNHCAFVRDGERLADDPFFGWTLGEWDLRDLGLWGYSMLSAPDVRSALQVMVERSDLETEAAQLALYEQREEATLAQTWAPNAAKSACWLHLMLCALRQLVGPDFEPLRLGLDGTDPVRVQGLSDRVGVSVEGLEAPIAFAMFSKHLLDRPIDGADLLLARVLEELWLAERAGLAALHDELAEVADAVVPLLAKGTPSPARLASALGITRAELKRKLDRIGSGIAPIVDAVRSGLASHLLARPDMTLVRAAEALGFETPEALTRAYERWWGSPISTGHGRSLRYT